jgi:hypothetical protein
MKTLSLRLALLSNPSSVLPLSTISSITDIIYPMQTRVWWFVFSRSEDTVSELLFRVCFHFPRIRSWSERRGVAQPTCLINTQLTTGIVIRPILLPPSSHFRATFVPTATHTTLNAHIQNSATPVHRATPTKSRARWLLHRPPTMSLPCLLQASPLPPPRTNLR